MSWARSRRFVRLVRHSVVAEVAFENPAAIRAVPRVIPDINHPAMLYVTERITHQDLLSEIRRKSEPGQWHIGALANIPMTRKFYRRLDAWQTTVTRSLRVTEEYSGGFYRDGCF